MGLSFYDEKSMEETVESLHFASHTGNENPILETLAGNIDQERMDLTSIQQDDRDQITLQ